MTERDDERTGPQEGVSGVVEDLKGKAKDVLGSATGSDSLRREGKAQQDKAESQRKAAAKEAEAERARAEADRDEARERAAGREDR